VALSLTARLVAARSFAQVPPNFCLSQKFGGGGGIEAASLSRQVKAATCLAPHFYLAFATPAGQDLQTAALRAPRPGNKGQFAEASLLSALFHPTGRTNRGFTLN